MNVGAARAKNVVWDRGRVGCRCEGGTIYITYLISQALREYFARCRRAKRPLYGRRRDVGEGWRALRRVAYAHRVKEEPSIAAGEVFVVGDRHQRAVPREVSVIRVGIRG